MQIATSFVNLHNNVDRFCAGCTKNFPFVKLHKKCCQICAGCQNIFLRFAQKMRAMWKIFVQVAQNSGFPSHCTKVGVFERNFCALCTSAKTARLGRRRAAEKKEKERERLLHSLSLASFLYLIYIIPYNEYFLYFFE